MARKALKKINNGKEVIVPAENTRGKRNFYSKYSYDKFDRREIKKWFAAQ